MWSARGASCEWHHARQPSSHRSPNGCISVICQGDFARAAHTELNTQSNCHSLYWHDTAAAVIPVCAADKARSCAYAKEGRRRQPSRWRRAQISHFWFTFCVSFHTDTHTLWLLWIRNSFDPIRAGCEQNVLSCNSNIFRPAEWQAQRLDWNVYPPKVELEQIYILDSQDSVHFKFWPEFLSAFLKYQYL